jgi:hypothetical protein
LKYILLFLFSLQAFGNEKVLKTFLKYELYNSSLNLILKNPEMYSRFIIDDIEMEKLINHVHPASIPLAKNLESLKVMPTPLNYLTAIHFLREAKYASAKETLNSLGTKTAKAAHIHYLRGILLLQSNELREALKQFKMCTTEASKLEERNLKESLKNRCIQSAARVLFTGKKYNRAISYLNLINKKELIWPYTLMDQAWAHYWQKNYGQALGKVVSYKAPILTPFIRPEAYYLRTLIYYQLCYYDKAQRTYDDFVNESKLYKKELRDFVSTPNLKKIYDPQNRSFLSKFFKTNKKDISILTYHKALKSLNTEIRKLKYFYNKYKDSKSLLKEIILDSWNNLKEVKSMLSSYYRDLHITLASEYLDEIESTNKNMVKIKLLLNSKIRKSQGAGLSKKGFKDNRLSLYEINGSQDKAIYEFIGGFWADEIGDYAFAISSACGGSK